MDAGIEKGIGEAVDKVLGEAELTAKLEEEKKKRAASCFEKIKKILEEDKCDLVPLVHIVGSQIRSEITIAAK